MLANRLRQAPGFRALWRVALWISPVVWLVILRLVNGKSISAESTVIHASIVAVVLGVAYIVAPLRIADQWVLPKRGIACVLFGIACALVYVLTGHTIAAWVTASLLCVLFLWLDLFYAHQRRWFTKGFVDLLLAALSAGAISAIAQIESRFSDEEFYIVGQFAGLWIWMLFVILAYRLLPHWKHVNSHGIRLNTRLIGAGVCVFSIIFASIVVWQYQTSFVPQSAPQFAGISPNQPFLCSTTQREPGVYAGSAVSARLLEVMAAEQQHTTTDFGMLALNDHHQKWADAFRINLLSEAAQHQYTGPSNSIKYGQFLAALRLYYYPRVKAAYPDLFSQNDDLLIRAWFAEINWAVYRLDWVDLLYAVAFRQLPSGVYANQDIGAGLVALLESGGYAPPELRSQNLALLAHVINQQPVRFRNPDDTYNYQVVWLQNQLFLTPFRVSSSFELLRKSYEWLLIQALPNGASPSYNHPDKISMAAISLVGATLLSDPRFIWLAERSLEDASVSVTGDIASGDLHAGMTGIAPDVGSCLIYGDSGPPMQAGPLAPDKIVLRDGWSVDAAYMLINLRFTGWHRYKATNTITLLYQGGILLNDDTGGVNSVRLPEGRSMVRDKRIPRENLNGLVVGRTGMSRVVYDLTGEGSEWAQDPPYYATVDRFETHADYDVCQIAIHGWSGWSQTRTIVFYHDGLIIVRDVVVGDSEAQAKLVWNMPGEVKLQGQGYSLRQPTNPAEMRILPIKKLNAPSAQYQYDVDSQRSEIAVAVDQGKLDTVTIFLLRGWAGASTRVIDNGGILNLTVMQGDHKVVYPLVDAKP